jgi:hypothetical protein
VSGRCGGPLVTLTVTIDDMINEGGGHVTVTGPMPACHTPSYVPCTRAWLPGTAVKLTASEPYKGDRLPGWTGGGCAGAGTCTPTLQSDTKVSAVFPGAVTSNVAGVSDSGRDTLRSRRADFFLPER